MIVRPGLEQIDGSGATAGQVPVWNSGNGGFWEPGDVAGSGAGGLPVFDIVAYGAVVDGTTAGTGTDDTAAVQATLNAAAAAGGGRIISSRPGICIIAGALQDTSGANAQLLLPAVDYGDGETVPIWIEGAVAPGSVVAVGSTTPVPVHQLVLMSTLTAGSGGALLGGQGPTGTAESFTNVELYLRNLTFRMPSNPTHTGLNLLKVACVDLDNVIVDAGSYSIPSIGVPTTSTSYGIKLPDVDNGAHTRLGRVDVVGFYNGILYNEHTLGQYVFAWACKAGHVFNGVANHASSFVRMGYYHCQTGIKAIGGAHYVDIWQLNVEHAASGTWATTYDIDDSSNYLHAYVRRHIVKATVGVDSTFTVNGAANLQTSQVGDPLGTTVYHARDRLTAAAGNTILTLGATPVANSPLVWVNNTIKWPTTDYTISGNVITFGAALAAGDAVLVKYETLNSAAGASSLSSTSIVDNFNRADNTSSLGSTSTGGVAWTALAGTWGISSNTAYVSANVAGSVNLAVVDAGRADCTVQVTIAATAATLQPGLVLRMATAGNGYVLEGGNGSTAATLFKGVGGTYTSIGASASNIFFAAGDVITAVLSGSSITIKQNGTTIITATDSTYNTVTKHGLHILGGPTALRFDDFSIT